ncbi:MAG TPA: hypothetical protein PLY89_09945, partial [Synergistaceae bacterium]|nr:hypothetical protein [Synergistaceae bacterium]
MVIPGYSPWGGVFPSAIRRGFPPGSGPGQRAIVFCRGSFAPCCLSIPLLIALQRITPHQIGDPL